MPCYISSSFCCSKSSVLLGLSLTVPLMVACLSIAVPLWIRNGYNFWIVQDNPAPRTENHQALGRIEVFIFLATYIWRFEFLCHALSHFLLWKVCKEKGWCSSAFWFLIVLESEVFITWQRTWSILSLNHSYSSFFNISAEITYLTL